MKEDTKYCWGNDKELPKDFKFHWQKTEWKQDPIVDIVEKMIHCAIKNKTAKILIKQKIISQMSDGHFVCIDKILGKLRFKNGVHYIDFSQLIYSAYDHTHIIRFTFDK